MTMSDLNESFWQLTVSVRVAKLLKDNGMEQLFEGIRDRYAVDCDSEYWVAIEALENLCEYVESNYNEYDETGTMYFSDQTIMEYFRLSLEEARLKKIRFTQTPSVQRAIRSAKEWMEAPGCYYCAYLLKLRPKQEWGCGILFEYDGSYFCEFYALLSRMVQVLAFYRENLPALRREVDQLKKVFAIVPYQPKGAAA